MSKHTAIMLNRSQKSRI